MEELAFDQRLEQLIGELQSVAFGAEAEGGSVPMGHGGCSR